MKVDLNRVDIDELLRRGKGQVLYHGAEGIVVREKHGGTVMTDITDGDALHTVLKSMDLTNWGMLVVKSLSALDTMRQNYGFSEGSHCTQWSYPAEEPPVWTPCDIRPLTMEYAQRAGVQYHQRMEYVAERIQAGQMWGLFAQGALAGFIGLHTEGAMGMLEVFPQYRHRGYGYTLEAFLIAWHLERNWVPYCHVVDGNEASIHLQKRLGLICGDQPALWSWQEEW